MPDENKHLISDLKVQTVGLVRKGANQQTFFMLKSEDSVMPETEDMAVEVEQPEAPVEKTESEETLAAPVQDEKPGVDEAALREIVRDEMAKAAPKPAEEKATEEGEQPVAKGEDDPVVRKLTALEKANQSLVERLEKAEQIARTERDARERQEMLIKAQGLNRLPVKAEDLTSHLITLYKADSEAGKFFYDLLTAVNNQMADTPMFKEAGSSVAPKDESVEEAVERLAKSGTPEEIKAALFAMSADESYAFLRERRRALKE